MRVIFVRVGTTCRIQPWDGDTFASLAQHVSKGLPSSDLQSLKPRDLFLLDTQHGVAYNNFKVSDIRDGSMIECRNHAYIFAAEHSSSWQQVEDVKAPEDEDLNHNSNSMQAFVRSMLDVGDSFAIQSLLWALTLALLTWITLALYAYNQLPKIYTRTPAYNSLFLILESCCVLLCITEVLLRIWSRFSYRQLLTESWLWVCGISVLPLVLYVASGQTVVIFEVNAIRLLFMSRLLFATPYTRGGMQACQQTVMQSARLLYMLLFFATLALLINASVLYYLERGTYSQDAQTWVRYHGYECTLVRNFPDERTLEEYHSGVRQLPTARAAAPACKWVGAVNETAAEFVCPASVKVNDTCKKIAELSQVTSIPEAMWMTVATLTTTGLGDVVPSSPLGQIFNSAVIYVAVTVLALPMTVISSKFEGNYRRFKAS